MPKQLLHIALKRVYDEPFAPSLMVSFLVGDNSQATIIGNPLSILKEQRAQLLLDLCQYLGFCCFRNLSEHGSSEHVYPVS